MDNKNSFILYHTQYNLIKELTDEQAGKLLKSIYEYEINGVVPKLEGVTKIVFIAIKEVLEINNKKYESICERNKRNIQKRWNTKNTTGISGIPKNTKNTDIDIDIDIDIDTDIDIKKENIKRKKFVKPTIEELNKYKEEINGTANTQHFIDYYESNGWLVGKNHMKDWKATYRNWNRKEQPQKKEPLKVPSWFNQEIEEIEATEEQVKEMEERFKQFR